VPLGVEQGLPVAVQLYADRWREDLCFEAAGLLEAAVGTFTPIAPQGRT
jgi:Asp-tRNA(Asn)/Glu-tRNA(Gln) amidotransferase A subunit family amidase